LGKPIAPADLAGFEAQGLAAIILDGVPGTAMQRRNADSGRLAGLGQVSRQEAH